MFGYKGGEAVKAELKKGSINQILKGTDIYEAGEFLDSIAGYGYTVMASIW